MYLAETSTLQSCKTWISHFFSCKFLSIPCISAYVPVINLLVLLQALPHKLVVYDLREGSVVDVQTILTLKLGLQQLQYESKGLVYSGTSL